MEHITFDSAEFHEGITRAGIKGVEAVKTAELVAAGELGRLSEREVPHDTGMLQDSQVVGHDEQGGFVGYNKVYAAHLHEHPEYTFQKGRKGKYLEDPMKLNADRFLRFMGESVKQELGL